MNQPFENIKDYNLWFYRSEKLIKLKQYLFTST